MDNQSLLTIACLTASVLFILSLRGLSGQETAKRGNTYGVVGMIFAVGATVLIALKGNFVPVIGAVAIAVAIGWVLAARVQMTAMPELVAVLHSFVGLAAVLVGFASYLDPNGAHDSLTIFHIEIWVDVFIGAITFTGSVLAFLKLRGTVSGRPTLLPGRHFLNLAMLVACVVCAGLYVGQPTEAGLQYLLIVAVIASVLGVHLVAAIGGADMPVVVSMLNSYSGWTAAAAGFMLSNDLLIITGALVGSSGAILSYIMCEAMNRSIWNVIFGGFGTEGAARLPKRQMTAKPGKSWNSTMAIRWVFCKGRKRDHRSRLRHGGCARAARRQRDDPALAERTAARFALPFILSLAVCLGT